MSRIINFLRNILYKIRGSAGELPQSGGFAAESRKGPNRGIITQEPLLALKDGFLVMVVDHRFSDVPGWVEWDAERGVLSIAQINGDVDEARVDLKEEYRQKLAMERKLLLVSNDNGESVVHFVPFLART